MWSILLSLTVLLALAAVLQAVRVLQKRCADCDPCNTSTKSAGAPEVELCQKDSLDEHLDALTAKLAAKESRLRLSKSKIRQTQGEIENLHAIDEEVQRRYREVMDSLKNDLLTNEKDCRLLQQQIEWVSRRRAELKSEVVAGQNMYGGAVTELARGLRDVQRAARPIPAAAAQQRRRPDPAAQLWASFERQERSLGSLRAAASGNERTETECNFCAL